MSKRKTTISDFFSPKSSQPADGTNSCARKVLKHNENDSAAASTYREYNSYRYDDKFQAQNVPADGSCFINALAHQLHRPLQDASAIRKEIVEFIRDHFRTIFYEAVDTALNQLNIRLDKEAHGLKIYLSLERILLTGEFPEESDVCWLYGQQLTSLSESPSLKIQLAMFHSKYKVKSLEEAHTAFQGMVPEVRSMMFAVEQLIRMMLICPVSSCTAERSFSALRRLKNWLRSTMTQQRLNSVSICHINSKILDSVDVTALGEEFAQRSDMRRGIFGQWTK